MKNLLSPSWLFERIIYNVEHGLALKVAHTALLQLLVNADESDSSSVSITSFLILNVPWVNRPAFLPRGRLNKLRIVFEPKRPQTLQRISSVTFSQKFWVPEGKATEMFLYRGLSHIYKVKNSLSSHFNIPQGKQKCNFIKTLIPLCLEIGQNDRWPMYSFATHKNIYLPIYP